MNTGMTYYTCYATPEERRADREKIDALLPKKEGVRPAGKLSSGVGNRTMPGGKKKIRFTVQEEIEYA